MAAVYTKFAFDNYRFQNACHIKRGVQVSYPLFKELKESMDISTTTGPVHVSHKELHATLRELDPPYDVSGLPSALIHPHK